MWLKKWFYKHALRFILAEHSKWWREGCKSKGIRLNFSGCFLRDAVFHATNLNDCEFLGARLVCADFTRADLSHAKLVNCKTQETNFSGSLGKLAERKDELIDDMWVVATADGAALQKKEI